MAFTPEIAAAALAALIGPDGSNLSARLYKSNTPADDTTDPATLTEGDFDGYSELRTAWTAPTVFGDGGAITYSDPFQWSKGSDPAKNQAIYTWALFLSGGDPAPSVLAVRQFPYPYSMDRAGKSIELDMTVAATYSADPPTGLVLTVEVSVVLRGRRLGKATRLRLNDLRRALSLVKAADAHEDARYERGGTRGGTFFNNTPLLAAYEEVRRRLDQLLGSTVSKRRQDTPIKQEIIGIIQPKL